jgi:hypothetical protein
MSTIIRLKHGLAVSWAVSNPVLDQGEPGTELDTGQLKVGDGITPWNDLPYTGSGGIELLGHINSSSPHPVYDDGPSFTLLYENVKV